LPALAHRPHRRVSPRKHRGSRRVVRRASWGQSLYNYFRDYDPQVGRYVESDPIGLHGGINTYAYVSGNPAIGTDRYGTAGLGVAGSALNKALQDLPDNICDLWQALCVKRSIVCFAARCRYQDCKGNKWFITITSWMPSRPSPQDVKKETPQCECIDFGWVPYGG